jgi:hypothetical protein
LQGLDVLIDMSRTKAVPGADADAGLLTLYKSRGVRGCQLHETVFTPSLLVLQELRHMPWQIHHAGRRIAQHGEPFGKTLPQDFMLITVKGVVEIHRYFFC